MSKEHKSVLLEASLRSEAIRSEPYTNPDTLTPEKMSKLMEIDPNLYHLMVKNRDRERSRRNEEKDQAQDMLIQELCAKVVTQEKRIATLEKWSIYLRGAACALGIIWGIATFIAPYVIPKGAISAGICKKVESCQAVKAKKK